MTKHTNYTGIDYSGPGSSVNRDAETGIRYGMISQHSVMPEALDDIYSNGDDLGFESMQSDLKGTLATAIESAIGDYGSICPRVAEAMAQEILESGEIEYADCLESGPYAYSGDGYNLQTTSDNNLWVFKSPYFTHAQFCSPCVPGAGNLDSYCPDGPKTYCLGHDWFDGGVAPYPVYNVADGSPVLSADGKDWQGSDE